MSFGYPAVMLPQVRNVYLEEEREAGELLPSQRHIADRAGIAHQGRAARDCRLSGNRKRSP